MTSYLEISPLDRTQDLKLVKSYCSCCLSESVGLIEATKCHHYMSYKVLFLDTPTQAPDGSHLCLLCHAMLVKIDKFNIMVKRSDIILRNKVTNINTPPFIQLEVYDQHEEIIVKHEIESKNVKVEPVEKFEVAVDTDSIYLLYHDDEDKNVEETNTNMTEIDPSLSDGLKVYAVPEHWDGKIEYINLTPEQLNQEKKEMANQVSFRALEFKCHDCIIGFNYEFKYNSHMETRHVKKEDSVLCEICKCFISVRNVKKHLITHYGRWRCCQCNIMFKSKNAIISHYNETHEKLQGNDFKCDQCDYEARSYRTLLNHKRKHNSPDKLNYQCEKCCKCFLNKESYKNHMESFHYTNQQFECKICNKIFKIKQRLRIHVKEVHEDNDNTYYCDICFMVFKKISTWRNHMAGHYNEYECDYCGLKFNRKFVLKDHILSKHLKSSTLVCMICSKAFSSKKALNTHIKAVHQGTVRPKNKICDYCGKGFAKSSTLKGHLNTHTGARPYNCEYCSANFGFKSALYTHTRILHFGGKRKRELSPNE